MELKKSVISAALYCLAACGGNGTEVANIANPNDTTHKKFGTEYYRLEMDFLPGWTYTDYGFDERSDPQAFIVEAPNTRTVAHVRRGHGAHFTIFEAFLEYGQDLEDYIRQLRPSEPIYQQREIEDGQAAHWAYVEQAEAGARGGSVLDFYASDNETAILWMRVELTGSASAREQAWEEFWDMVSTLTINPGTGN